MCDIYCASFMSSTFLYSNKTPVHIRFSLSGHFLWLKMCVVCYISIEIANFHSDRPHSLGDDGWF